MPHEVKMPQLGMTQDSGVIVSWLKAAGDAVAEGDALFEVETDKATMEVESAAAGFLAAVRAGEGDDVPVGDVIALIVDSAEDVSDAAPEPTAAQPDPVPDPDPRPEPVVEPLAVPSPAPAPRQPAAPGANATGRILASPKARRLALERGIDLAALRAQGAAEPIHAADLSRATSGGQSHLTAVVRGDALDALLDRSESADRTTLLGAFAAGAWRALFDPPEPGVALRRLDGTTTIFGSENVVLTLVDLCDTRLTAYAAAAAGITLAVARGGDGYVLTLSFSEGTLPMAHAVALLDDIAARVGDPIRQLL